MLNQLTVPIAKPGQTGLFQLYHWRPGGFRRCNMEGFGTITSCGIAMPLHCLLFYHGVGQHEDLGHLVSNMSLRS